MKSSRPCKPPKHQVVIPWRDHFLIFLQSRFIVSRRHCHAPSCLNWKQTSGTLFHLCWASTRWRTTSKEAFRYWHPEHLGMLVWQKGKKTASPLPMVATKRPAQPPVARNHFGTTGSQRWSSCCNRCKIFRSRRCMLSSVLLNLLPHQSFLLWILPGVLGLDCIRNYIS